MELHQPPFFFVGPLNLREAAPVSAFFKQEDNKLCSKLFLGQNETFAQLPSKDQTTRTEAKTSAQPVFGRPKPKPPTHVFQAGHQRVGPPVATLLPGAPERATRLGPLCKPVLLDKGNQSGVIVLQPKTTNLSAWMRAGVHRCWAACSALPQLDSGDLHNTSLANIKARRL